MRNHSPSNLFGETPFTVMDAKGNTIEESVMISDSEDLRRLALLIPTEPLLLMADCPDPECTKGKHTFTVLYDGEIYVNFNTIIENIRKNPTFMKIVMADAPTFLTPTERLVREQ